MESELSLSKDMEEEVVRGMESPVSVERLGAIQNAAQTSSLETQSIKTGVKDAVKNLEEQSDKMFPNKEEVAETLKEELPKTEEKIAEVTQEAKKKIMGMNPVAFGLTLAGLGFATFLTVKYFKAKNA